MSDTQMQALQRFAAGLIAALIGIGIAALQSQEFRDLIGTMFDGDGLWTGLILAAIPPIVLFLGKLQAGPTVQAPPPAGPEGTRGITPANKPGLFG